MLEFLYKNNSLITHAIEALAAIIGLFCLKKFKGTAAIFFIWLLVYLFVISTIGGYPKYYNYFEFLEPLKTTEFKSNLWWYTIFFDVLAVIFFSIIYQKILINKKQLLLVKYSTIIFLILSIGSIMMETETLFISCFPSIYILGAIIIIFCSGFYFIQILQNESILTFSKSLYFYISVAIFLWWLIITPLVFYDKYYILEDKNFILVKRSIYIFSNIFMYSTFAIGLIVSKPEHIKE